MAVVKLSQAAARRILVVVVPPVDELDLVGPLQVFSAVNRLAARPIYAIDVVTTGQNLQVAGEAGVLTFLAHRRLQDVTHDYDSALLVCGLTSRHKRDDALFAGSSTREIACVASVQSASALFSLPKPAC